MNREAASVVVGNLVNIGQGSNIISDWQRAASQPGWASGISLKSAHNRPHVFYVAQANTIHPRQNRMLHASDMVNRRLVNGLADPFFGVEERQPQRLALGEWPRHSDSAFCPCSNHSCSHRDQLASRFATWKRKYPRCPGELSSISRIVRGKNRAVETPGWPPEIWRRCTKPRRLALTWAQR